MSYRIRGALIVSLSALALAFGANETFARSGAAPGVTAGAAHGRGFARPSGAPSLRHFRGNRAAVFWPSTEDFYDSSNGVPPADFAEPASRDIRYTYTYDVPWDWVHRYPPNVLPSDRAYVTECPEQTVTVRGKGGKEQTVNIMRCY